MNVVRCFSLADGVGSFTGSPEVTLLCVGNMASIFVDFIYQITFYSAVMGNKIISFNYKHAIAIVGKWEMESEAKNAAKHRYKLSIPIGNSDLKVPEIKRVVTTRSRKKAFFEVVVSVSKSTSTWSFSHPRSSTTQ